MVGYYKKGELRLDHMGFGLVLKKADPVKEENKEEEDTKEAKKEEVKEQPKEEESKGDKKKAKKEKGGTKKISSRDGGSAKLIDLLNEGRERAIETFKKRDQGNDNVQVSEAEWEMAAETLGISAIKYFEFNRDRKTQYVFDFDQVLNS